MNVDNQMEQELARLGKLMKTQPSFVAGVMKRIEPASKPRFSWGMPISLSLAASVLLMMGLSAFLHQRSATSLHQARQGQTPATDAPAELVHTSTEWQTVSDRSVTLEGDVPAREVSRQKFERVQYINPQQHTTFERLVPREKVTFLTLANY